MKNLELQKRANDVRKGIVTQFIVRKQDIPADPCQPQIFLHFYILRR